MDNIIEKNDSRTVDIETLTRTCTAKDVDLDFLLKVNGLPVLCLGFGFTDNEVRLYSGLNGKLVVHYVESPTEAGAAVDYTPEDAVLALLEDAGITVGDDDSFNAGDTAYPDAKPLDMFSDEEYVIDVEDADSAVTFSYLRAAVEDAYTGYDWE